MEYGCVAGEVVVLVVSSSFNGVSNRIQSREAVILGEVFETVPCWVVFIIVMNADDDDAGITFGAQFFKGVLAYVNHLRLIGVSIL